METITIGCLDVRYSWNHGTIGGYDEEPVAPHSVVHGVTVDGGDALAYIDSLEDESERDELLSILNNIEYHVDIAHKN